MRILTGRLADLSRGMFRENGLEVWTGECRGRIQVPGWGRKAQSEKIKRKTHQHFTAPAPRTLLTKKVNCNEAFCFKKLLN